MIRELFFSSNKVQIGANGRDEAFAYVISGVTAKFRQLYFSTQENNEASLPGELGRFQKHYR